MVFPLESLQVTVVEIFPDLVVLRFWLVFKFPVVVEPLSTIVAVPAPHVSVSVLPLQYVLSVDKLILIVGIQLTFNSTVQSLVEASQKYDALYWYAWLKVLPLTQPLLHIHSFSNTALYPVFLIFK